MRRIACHHTRPSSSDSPANLIHDFPPLLCPPHQTTPSPDPASTDLSGASLLFTIKGAAHAHAHTRSVVHSITQTGVDLLSCFFIQAARPQLRRDYLSLKQILTQFIWLSLPFYLYHFDLQFFFCPISISTSLHNSHSQPIHLHDQLISTTATIYTPWSCKPDPNPTPATPPTDSLDNPAPANPSSPPSETATAKMSVRNP